MYVFYRRISTSGGKQMAALMLERGYFDVREDGFWKIVPTSASSTMPVAPRM